MKNTISVLLIIIISSVGCLETNEQDNFKWLLGNWERTNNQKGKTTTETWEVLEQKYRGLGVTVVGSDTVFFENMELTKIENEMHLIINTHQHSEPVHFIITQTDENSFTAENLTNDFPKKIHYQKTNDGLKATISGGGKGIDFLFEKVKN